MDKEMVYNFLKNQNKSSRSNIESVDNIKFAREDDSVKFPTKRDEDGCYDIYAHITDDFVIPPHTNRLVPTGLYSAFDKKYRIAIRERGSNTKTNMIYNGNDKKIYLSNHTNEIIDNNTFIYVPASKAIAQFAVEYVPVVNVSEISVEELQKIDSERGAGALGSSNK